MSFPKNTYEKMSICYLDNSSFVFVLLQYKFFTMRTEKKIILIVEKSRTQTQLLKEALRSGDYRIETASNGEIAARKTDDKKYDLILLNAILPDLSGYKMLESIQESRKNANTPVIMLSNSNGSNALKKSLKLGAIDLLTEPVNPEILLLKIEKILGEKKFS